jgi:hypothetical protein
MLNKLLTPAVDEDLLKAEKWFCEISCNVTSPEPIQTLILYKLYQLEEKLDKINNQTQTHWAN